jgi:hypothetical protein
MEAVREIKKVTGKQITIELPNNFAATEVEVIVIPYEPFSLVKDNDGWREDFLAVSRWDITEEEVKIKSWTIAEL